MHGRTELDESGRLMRPDRNAVLAKWIRNGAVRLLQRPVRTLPVLLVLAVGLEGAQYIPGVFAGARAIGEVVRNLTYALVGAVVFEWLVVEVPAARRRRATYAFHKVAFQTLLSAGPGLLYQYEHAARVLQEDLDIWDEVSLRDLAKKVESVVPQVFRPERAGLLRTTVDLAIPRALTELNTSASYLDLDVAHALSQFPHQDGVTMLQVQTDISGNVDAVSDAHITWSLLQAARRLFSALIDSGAYGPDVFQAMARDPPVSLSPDVLLPERRSEA